MLVMEMSNKKQQIPTIRFKGFTDTWEQRKFSNIVNRVSQQSNDSNLPKVEFEDIISGEGRLNKDISSKFDSRKGTVFEPEFILYGKLRPYLKNWLFPNFKGIALGDFWVFEPNNSSSIFDYYLIQSDKYQTVANLSSGTKMPRSDWKTVSETEFSIPVNIEEQAKIGTFFKQLDDTIALHQRQLNNYKQQKKYMLQKMFPKDGEKVPEVRFDGFTEEWEQCNLGDVAMIKTGYPFNSEDFDGSGKYLVITNGNIQNDLAFVDNSLGNRIDVSDTVLLNNYELNIGDVLVTMDGTVGRTAKVICSNQIIAQRVGRLIAKDNSEFLYQSLNTGDFSKEMKKVSHGGTIKHISLTEISDYAMFVPATVEEQTKIGAFFKHLDDATDHHQQKVNGYQQLKNAMLQQMFV